MKPSAQHCFTGAGGPSAVDLCARRAFAEGDADAKDIRTTVRSQYTASIRRVLVRCVFARA